MNGAPRGRFAPSPTGRIHLGNASSALLAWLSVRSRNGRLVMRIEDLDPRRSRADRVDEILHDLRWLGLDWDEGPGEGGPHAPYNQGARGSDYHAAFQKLREDGFLYACFCSRKDIAAAASAPQGPDAERRYGGACRRLDPGEAARRVAAGERHAWRFRVEPEHALRFDDLVCGPSGSAEPPGDFVVHRSDGVPAYQLAVVVDDAAMEIEEVVRGCDLLSSTPDQLILFDALGLPAPRYGHVPLLMGPDGARLSKRHGGITLRELREGGVSAHAVLGYLARLVGLRPEAAPSSPQELLPGFELGKLADWPREVDVDPGFLTNS